jgi:hypothetical protein
MHAGRERNLQRASPAQANRRLFPPLGRRRKKLSGGFVSDPTFDARLCTGILRRCPDAVIFADREGVIRLWNEGVAEPRRRDRGLEQRLAALEAKQPPEVFR